MALGVMKVGCSMNCIKEKCKYCREDTYMRSFYECTLYDYTKFKKNADIDCPINDVIKHHKVVLNKIIDYKDYIERQNKDK